MGKAIGLIAEWCCWVAILLLIAGAFDEEIEELANLLVLLFT